jgi:co-chaperonin GroES (HSP10)
MGFQVFGDRVVFKELAEQEDKTPGGIIIPAMAKDNLRAEKKNFKGEVIFIGDKCTFVKIGDIVAYDQYGVGTFEFEGNIYNIAREQDLLGKYTK